MSESCRENLPLLCDDYSNEDFHIHKSSTKFQLLHRYSASSGRARSQAIGAAAILTKWPEHFSSLLTYWWIGLGMIAFLIFVIYNSIVAISMLPPTHLKPFKLHNITSQTAEYMPEKISNKTSETNIFMHIFVASYEELNIKNYLPYIHTFSKKFLYLKHNLIIVLKDVSNDNLNNLSDELNNEIALNSLWIENKKNNIIKLGKNINIQIISLAKYMDGSPLKKYWRRLPQQLFPFLTRCIAIWDKGGVAFDPLILTPNSPHLTYIERLEHILNNLNSGNVNKYKKENLLKTPKKKVDNIRDIIDNIENQDKNIIQESLSEAENKMDTLKIENLNNIKRNANELAFKDFKKTYTHSIKNKTRDSEEIVYKDKINKNSDVLSDESVLNKFSETYKIRNENRPDNEISTKTNLLPMFLNHLFHEPRNITERTDEQNNAIINITLIENSRNSTLNDILIKNQQNSPLRTNFLEKKVSNTKSIKNSRSSENENNISLSIDLKGNLIATETPCHAFIGTIFSNAIHHCDDESITNFIITELSIFCEGKLSTCKALDVILL